MFIPDKEWIERQAVISRHRLKPRLEANFDKLFRPLLRLYGNQYDFFYHLEDLVKQMEQSGIERSPELKAQDGSSNVWLNLLLPRADVGD